MQGSQLACISESAFLCIDICTFQVCLPTMGMAVHIIITVLSRGQSGKPILPWPLLPHTVMIVAVIV